MFTQKDKRTGKRTEFFKLHIFLSQSSDSNFIQFLLHFLKACFDMVSFLYYHNNQNKNR